MLNFIVNFFKRIFGIAEAEANSVLDSLENPIRMTEQGIRDLKQDLNKSIEALASVKAMNIRTQKALSSHKSRSSEYEKKAVALLQRAETGAIDPAEADRLAREALAKKKQADTQAKRSATEHQRLNGAVANMEGKINDLRSNIGEWENELVSLKSRVQVSEATTRVNKQLSGADSSSTVARLERMREKVEQQEALAESYTQIADEARSIDDEINKALGGAEVHESDEDLAMLKAKLGMGGSAEADVTDTPEA